jgi:hypothetical protein
LLIFRCVLIYIAVIYKSSMSKLGNYV